MEWDQSGPVDPEVRAYVYSLISALGGTGADQDGRYVLGDDALACLKDIKKWLRLYDEKTNRLDVARCLAEANLVSGDLLPILALLSETDVEDKFKSKIALACLELLVPLTWPIEKNDAQMTTNHHLQIPALRLAQTTYKRAILEHEPTLILRTCVRIALPSIALPMGERSSRDEGIIKLLLYFCRNIAMISLPENLEKSEQPEISRSVTIEAFHHQEVLALLLTIASNMGEDFNTQDTVILEVLFHLLKGVDVEKLFMDKKELQDANGNDLKSLLAKEASMHRGYAKNAPSRHNRFGTMIWVQRDGEGRHSTVSGQHSLKDNQKTMDMMDKSKKWNKPKQRRKGDDQMPERFDLPVSLTESAKRHLHSFVEEFLDSGFNPLFDHIRKALERESERVLEAHWQQYFYLISWFLEAERVRRQRKSEANKKRQDKKIEETFEADSFALIASVLIQENFVLLNRFMQDRLDMKAWREVQAGARCFSQTLLIVQDMAESPLEEDQDIAENIQNRIFYEETTHDRIIAILRGYKDQGFGYLNTCTELAHVFLRMLERYSREHVDLQIRSRRRARKTKKAEAKQRGEDSDNDNASELEDVKEAEQTIRERKFDFVRFAAKFITQGCVDTFVAFTKFYNDLDVEQLKRAHRFFYRVAFKQNLSVMLFRLDIIALFYKMVKGPEGLDSKSSMFKEWDDFARQLFKKLIRKMEERPKLAIELLFSKDNSTAYYLEYGHEKQTQKASPKPPPTLEVVGNMPRSEQISVVVAVLHDQNIEYLDWILKALLSAVDERRSWEAEATARAMPSMNEDQENSGAQPDQSASPPKPSSIVLTPPNEDVRLALFKDAHLRLLMTLCGFECLGIDDELDTSWIIPSVIPSHDLKETHSIIDQFRSNPIFTYGHDPLLEAKDLLHRKPLPKAPRVVYDDDSDGSLGIVSDGEEDFLFPVANPTKLAERKANALAKLKNQRRKRHRDAEGAQNELTEEEILRRRRMRAEADLEKQMKIKSTEFVYDSDWDEEEDRLFFEKEEAKRVEQRNKTMALVVGKKSGEKLKQGHSKSKKKVDNAEDGRKGKKRKATITETDEGRKRQRGSSNISSESGDSDDDDMDIEHDLDSPRLGIRGMLGSSERSDEDAQEEETPLSSPPLLPKKSKLETLITDREEEEEIGSPPSSQRETRGKIDQLGLHAHGDEDDLSEDVRVSAASMTRNRGRAILEDSDDE